MVWKSGLPTRESQRYIGIELAGAKNQKTAIAVVEFYPKEKKVFLLDLFDRIVNQEGQTNDEALLEMIEELSHGVRAVGVNVPLELPPGLMGDPKSPAAKWMRNFADKKEFTAYTQRPIELWMKHKVLPLLPENHRFEIDETLGGNKAPLTARMQYLKRFWSDYSLVEVWPKLTVAFLARQLKIHSKFVKTYRQFELGAHSREEILIALAKKNDVFIYERDLAKLSHSLAVFDAFMCAYTALLADHEYCAQPPKNFPIESGWVQFPTREWNSSKR